METVDKEAKRSEELLVQASRRRETWVSQNIDYIRMYMSEQWEADELKVLESTGRFPVTINIVGSIVDSFVAILAGDTPRYKAVPAQSGDEEKILAAVADFTLEYIAYISHFKQEFAQSMLDYTLAGIGWVQADIDPSLDYGAGEVVNRTIRWTDVYWDWRASRPGFTDRQWVAVFRAIAAGHLKAMFPEMKSVITEATKQDFKQLDVARAKFADHSGRINANTNFPGSDIILPTGDGSDVGWLYKDDEKELPVIERYQIVYKQLWSVFDPAEGVEQYMDDQELLDAPLPADVKTDAFQVTIPRVRRITSIGGYKVIDDTILDISTIPVIPFVKMGAGAFYPQSPVSRIYDIQKEYNKRRMTIMENALFSSVGRMLAPQGMIDRDEWNLWGKVAGGLIEYKKKLGLEKDAFIPLNAQQLPSQFFYLDQSAIELAEYCFGMNSMFMGSGKNMPDTYRQTLMVEEYGQRRIKAMDMCSIEDALERLGQVTLELAQGLYGDNKLLSIVDGNERLAQVVINKVITDEEGNEKRIYTHDVRGAKFNVRIIKGSTMPSNRYALLELYTGLWKDGLIDDQTMLEETDIVDIDKVLERVSKIRQATETINALQEQLKEQGSIVEALKKALVRSDVKTQSGEVMLSIRLAAMQREMQEKLGKALTDLSMKSFQSNVEREEKYLQKLANVRMKNQTDLYREKLNAQAVINRSRSKPSGAN